MQGQAGARTALLSLGAGEQCSSVRDRLTEGPGHKTLLYLVFRQHRGSCERVPVRSVRHYI